MNHRNHQSHRELEPLWNNIDKYFVDVSSRCPYGMDRKAMYHQAVFGWLDDHTMGRFLEKGYRRNGNSMYNMRCPHCSLCVPIRMRPERFVPNRNQKRVLKKNRGRGSRRCAFVHVSGKSGLAGKIFTDKISWK